MPISSVAPIAQPGADQINDGLEPAANNRDYVNSLARGLEILRAFSRRRKRMTLSEVAAETAMTRAAARRLLLTLVPEGYAEMDGKLFELTPQVLELGFSVMSFRALLAETREQGWALADQELEIGLFAIAIPLRRRSGEVAGAINVGVPTLRATPADMVRKILPRLNDTAARIAAAPSG